MGAALSLGPGFWQRALATPAAPVQPGDSPYGPLQPPDVNGLQLPPGFTSRVVASSLLPVAGTSHVWHAFPDGGACIATGDGGWIYVSNSENPPPLDAPLITGLLPLLGAGGAGAIRFAADGTVIDAYPILTGSVSNCAGGLTPWGTWLSCEEWEESTGPYAAGRVWECDPFGAAPAVVRPSLGRFKHEMAATDPVRHHVYLSEDQPDGLLYRYTPPAGTWGSGAALEGGLLEAMAVAADGTVTWLPVANHTAPAAPLRTSVAGATHFDGGEGLLYDADRVYLSTKGDDRVWVHDITAQTMSVLYDSREFPAPVLSGVDNLAVSAAHDLYVAEDGGNLEVCVITPDLHVATVVRMTGPQHGTDLGGPLPTVSEVTGLAFSPDGNRLYFNSERGNGIVPVGPGPGILYEVTGPFRGGTLAAEPEATPVPPASPSPSVPPPTTVPASRPSTGGRLAATGGATATGPAAVATAAAAALWRLRQRTGRPAD
jgi:secreted PhoX family phosphatase